MKISVGLENGFEGRSIAWALDYPGCFSYGKNGSEAIVALPQAVLSYQAWLDSHTADSWLKDLGDFDVRLVETWQFYEVDEFYELVEHGAGINSWFRHDWKPLTALDARRGVELLGWGRKDLLALLELIPPQKLDEPVAGERWTRRGILAHVATIQWWLLDRLDKATIIRTQLPKDPFERLQVTSKIMDQAINELAGEELVLGKAGEFWSPRKLLRRAAWHLRDHIEHIRKLG
ncbi:MAG: DinB family protein [Anaerolineaceae bacterium]|nr:DinB family protein [Anaerolineaceae bacterium]